jgi:hypothetical protein
MSQPPRPSDGCLKKRAKARRLPCGYIYAHENRKKARTLEALIRQLEGLARRQRCGLRFGSGWRSEVGNDSRSAGQEP